MPPQMAKTKSALSIDNHKLTDFFTRKSSQPTTSQPTPSSSQTSNSSKGKKSTKRPEVDEALASLVSIFHSIGPKSVEKVYLECGRDLAKATSVLTRRYPPMSQQGRQAPIGAFEKLKTLSPTLTREKFDAVLRECGGDVKEVSRKIFSPEYRQALRGMVKSGGSGSTSQTISGSRKLTSKSSSTATLPNSPMIPNRLPHSNKSKVSSQSVRDIGKGKSQPIAIPPRQAKKENAPPVDIISISSERSHYTISSCSEPTHISISSDPSVPDHGDTRSYLAPIDAAIPPPPRRRSPRTQPEPVVKQERLFSPLKTDAKSRRKRKLPFDSSSEECIDLTNDDVIYAAWKPASSRPAVKAEPPSSKRAPPSKKSAVRCRTKEKVDTEMEDIEIIPSSQSDEKELTVPKATRKNMKVVKDLVVAWRASSQTSGPIDVDLSYDASVEVDNPMDVDDYPCAMDVDACTGDEMADTAVQKSPTAVPSSPYTRHPPSTPYRTPPQSSSPSRCIVESTPTGKSVAKAKPTPAPIITALPNLPSPKTSSAGSSSTKVYDAPSYQFGTPTRAAARATPSSTPNKKQIVEVVLPSSTHRPTEQIVPSPRSSPCAIDTKTKTAYVIAQIKANAEAAAAEASPSGSDSENRWKRPAPLRSLSDNDSELDDDEFFSKPQQRGKRAVTPQKHDNSGSPLPDIEGVGIKLSPPKLRRSGRHRVSSPSPTSAPTGTFAFSALHPPPGALPKTLINSVVSAKKPRNSGSWDFSKLMREKRSGGAKAPGAMALQSYDLSKYDRDDWDREEGPSGSGEDDGSEDGRDLLLKDEARRRALGVDVEDDLKDIFAKDRAGKGKKPKKKVTVGIKFFDSPPEPDAYMDVEEPLHLPDLPDEATGPAVDPLRKALKTEDWYAISCILRTRSLVKPDELIVNGLLPWVVEVALSQDKSVSQSASRLLDCLGNCRLPHTSQTISLNLILTSLARLGPNKDILEVIGMEAVNFDGPSMSTDRRHSVLRRLIAVVKVLGQTNLLDHKDVASIVTLLVVIGLDWEMPLELQLDIAETVEVICASYCSSPNDSHELIAKEICSKIKRFSLSLDAANKERLLLLFPRNSPIVQRISQWVALVILSPDPDRVLASESLDEPPPLEYISTLIGSNSSEADPSNPFKIGRDDDVDYSALCHLIEVLARAIDNVPAYVALEKRKNLGGQSLVKNSSFTSDSTAVDLAVDKFTNPIKRLEPSEPSLQTIIHSLTYLSSKIVSSKAVDASPLHAKLMLENLRNRIRYQCEEVKLSRSGDGKPKMRSIEAYLTRR